MTTLSTDPEHIAVSKSAASDIEGRTSQFLSGRIPPGLVSLRYLHWFSRNGTEEEDLGRAAQPFCNVQTAH